MITPRRRSILVGLLAVLIVPTVVFRRVDASEGVVATVHPAATQAGQNVFDRGGNAVDAALAAAFTLGVVDCHNSGIGGGCFILLRLPDGTLIAIDGRETAPAAARRDMYVHRGEAQRELSKTGPLAIATPGALAAYAYALDHFGSVKLAEVILPAAEIAKQGFVVDRTFASRLKNEATVLARFDGSHAALLTQNGHAYRYGERLRLPDLAKTYRAIAERGTDWFYRGPFANQVGAWMQANGGILTAEDLKNYQVRLRKPVRSEYRGYTIVGFPPPSSGGIHVAEILNVLENFNLAKADSGEFVHLISEAMKLAFADRAHWLGDPDFAQVPRGLISKPYAKQLAGQIRADRATDVAGHGTPADWKDEIFGKHTTHIAAADRQGYWVAITTTNNTSFGSKVIVPGTGVVLNNQMDDFSIQPGVPNAFGLIGAEANSIAPGKRPLSSMSPTIVLQGDKPILTLGAAGGPRIITQVVLTIVRMIDRGMPLNEAVAAARFHHQWRPRQLFVEAQDEEFALPVKVLESLRDKGHEIRKMPYAGVTQAVGLSGDGRSLIAVEDPRVPKDRLAD